MTIPYQQKLDYLSDISVIQKYNIYGLWDNTREKRSDCIKRSSWNSASKIKMSANGQFMKIAI